MESTPSSVTTSKLTKQGGEVRARWAWTEPSVWTDRMLTALETGVKGDVWFSLMDKVYSRRNLEAAFVKVKANKGSSGVDHVSIERFEQGLEMELERLETQLRQGTYTPNAVRRVWIPKGSGKMRPLGIPTVRDRVVQTAMRNVLEPIFEREFSERSYGFRPGRGAKDALREVACLLDSGYRYIVDADIQGYFDAIPKTKLLASVKARVSDGRVLSLVSQYLNQPVMEGLNTWTPETGTPQGAVISPLLANIYLNPLDHILAGAGMEMRRYADDFVVLCRTRQEAETALDMIRAWMEEAELTLHPEKTCIVDMTQQGNYFEFLGYRFKYSKNRDYRFPTPRSLKKIREGIRAKTRRTHGHSLEHIIATINPLLRGWFEYFKHSHYTIPEEIDGWVRMRLRSILRKRAGRKGRGRGLDQNRYPNKFFAEYGLYCLKTAYAQAVQSPPG